MGLADAPVKLAAETSLRDITDGLKREAFDLVVIDSIQTLWSDAHEAGPGSVTQVRAAAASWCGWPRSAASRSSWWATSPRKGPSPGPRVIEHMVDAVSPSRASAATRSASCAAPRTASAPPTRSASSRWATRAWRR
jgi:DNA repair protein RadA/Sms